MFNELSSIRKDEVFWIFAIIVMVLMRIITAPISILHPLLKQN